MRFKTGDRSKDGNYSRGAMEHHPTVLLRNRESRVPYLIPRSPGTISDCLHRGDHRTPASSAASTSTSSCCRRHWVRRVSPNRPIGRE
ncbi:MAG: hypothetical protein ACE5EE_02845 [Fidelibacterota bacterium]